MGPWMLESWLGMFIDGLKKKCHSFSFTVRTGLVLLNTWLLKKKKNFLFIYRLDFG